MKCKPGFHLTKEKCEENQCTCPNGEKAEGQCSTDGDEKCKECKPGFHLTKEKCEKNQCSCKNGTEAEGKDCLTNGDEKCMKCKPGFVLNEKKCEDKPKDECKGLSKEKCKENS